MTTFHGLDQLSRMKKKSISQCLWQGNQEDDLNLVGMYTDAARRIFFYLSSLQLYVCVMLYFFDALLVNLLGKNLLRCCFNHWCVSKELWLNSVNYLDVKYC